MAKDVRYHELLGLDPDVETPPTHFELLELEFAESDADTISTAFKTKMRKLQQIKSSKHKGFIEMLKEDLRRAKRVLSNQKQRDAYEKALKEAEKERKEAEKQKVVEDFTEKVSPFIMLGEITKHFYDVLIAQGKGLGLEEAECKKIIFEMAEKASVPVNLEDKPKVEDKPKADPGTSGAKTPVQGAKPLDTGSGTYRAVKGPDAGKGSGFYPPGSAVNPRPGVRTPRAPSGPTFRPGLGDLPPRRNVRATAPRNPRVAPPIDNQVSVPASPVNPHERYPGLYSNPQNSGPQNRFSAPYQVRPPSSVSTQPTTSSPVIQPPKPQNDPAYEKRLASVKETFNKGAKIAKVAIKAHRELSFYFPPKNNKTYITRSLDGISYEKIFAVESKLYGQAQRLFEKAKQDIRNFQLKDGLPDNFIARLERFINSLRNWSRRCREVKMKQMSGLSKREELKVWNEFIRDPRSAEMTNPI